MITLQILEPICSGSPFDMTSNSPEGGTVDLVSGQTFIGVVFAVAKASVDYIFDELEVENLVDENPLVITLIRTARGLTGFSVQLAPTPDSDNYKFRWHVRFP